MKAYLCVYRQFKVRAINWAKSKALVHDNPKLRVGKFLRRYKRNLEGSTTGRFYDWGDDPAFFGAEEFLGDVRQASWGVCRPDVRRQLSRGDFVVFFCAQQQLEERSRWTYHYIGVGTVSKVIRRRSRLWTVDAYRKYRKFYNLLIDEVDNHKEVLFPHHDDDWEDKLQAPYILFEGSVQTHFNVRKPLLVATYDSRNPAGGSDILESWQLDDQYVREIDKLIPIRDGGKKLRTSHHGNAHRHMPLSCYYSTRQLQEVRRDLVSISKAIVRRRS